MIDASCVIAIEQLALLPKLTLLFNRLLVPKAVRVELFRRRRMKNRIKKLMREFAFLEACDEYDQGAVDVLMTGRKHSPKKDGGEAEAVVQAATAGAMIIVDETRGRQLARGYGLEVHGTIWILDRLHDLGVLAAPDVRSRLMMLRGRGVRFPVEAADELLRRLGQAPVGSRVE